MLKKSVCVGLLAVLLCLPASTLADVVGYRNDLGFSGVTKESVQYPLKITWVEVTGATRSHPVVIGDKLYIGTTWGLVCYNAKWGTKIWQLISKDFMHSSPFYADGRLYAGYTNAIYCVDAKTGFVYWKYSTGDNSVNSSPTVHEGKVYFGSNQFITCLDASNGKKLWDIGCPNPIEHSIAIMDGQFFVSSNDMIYAFGLQHHNKIWEYQLPNQLQHGFAVSKMRVFVSVHDTIISLNAKTGQVVWKKFYPGTARNAVCYDNENVYASFEQYLYCLDANTGKFKWQFEAGFFIESAPTIAGNFIWVGGDDFLLYAIHRETGERAYFIMTGSTSLYTLINNGSLFSVSVYGELYAYVHDTKQQNYSVTYELWIGKNYARLNNHFASIDSPPYIKNNRTMVPFRAIGEALGAEINWYPENKRATYALKAKFIALIVGEKNALVNGKNVSMEIPAEIKDNRLFIPLRFVSENLGAKVTWEATEKKITIEYFSS